MGREVEGEVYWVCFIFSFFPLGVVVYLGVWVMAD